MKYDHHLAVYEISKAMDQNQTTPMKTTSARSYTGMPIDAMAEVSVTPRDIVAELEEAFTRNFLKPVRFTNRLSKQVSLTDLIGKNPTMSFMGQALADMHTRRQKRAMAKQAKRMLRLWFGRFGLEKDEIAMVEKHFDGLETLDDKMSSMISLIEAIKSRKTWKTEQQEPQNPIHYSDLCKEFQLPPRTKGRSHQPAYYQITGPNGVTVDLSKKDRNFAPKLCTNPPQAFRAFLTRLGGKGVGGDVAILNKLLKAPMVEITNSKGEKELCYKWLPSYRTVNCGAWYVFVGWRLNPKCSSGEFHRESPEGYVPPFVLNFNGELERYNPNVHSEDEILTASELDYQLLCDQSDLAVTDEEGEVVDYMNEEEEFLTCFPERENEPNFIDFSKYCEDDEEMNLFAAVGAIVERSESGITLGDIRSKAFVNDYLHEGIRETQRALAALESAVPDGETEMWKDRLKEKLVRLEMLDEQATRLAGHHSDYDLIHHWYRNDHGMWTIGRDFDSHKPSPVEIAGASTMPENKIETPKTISHDLRPWPLREFQMTLGQSKQLRRQKQVCQSIIHGRFGMLVREKAAQCEFERALQSMLG